jgi:hypothetical protein
MDCANECQLLGEERKSLACVRNDVIDPQPTLQQCGFSAAELGQTDAQRNLSSHRQSLAGDASRAAPHRPPMVSSYANRSEWPTNTRLCLINQ